MRLVPPQQTRQFRSFTNRHGVLPKVRGASPHTTRYSTKVVASNKMPPNTRRPASWAEASAKWRSKNLWRRSGTVTDSPSIAAKTGFSILPPGLHQRLTRGPGLANRRSITVGRPENRNAGGAVSVHDNCACAPRNRSHANPLRPPLLRPPVRMGLSRIRNVRMLGVSNASWHLRH